MVLRLPANLLYLVLFSLCIMGNTRQRNLRKVATLGRKPQSHVEILRYQTWATGKESPIDVFSPTIY